MDAGLAANGPAHQHLLNFLVANHIAAGEVKVEYCLTAEMLADFFTKHFREVSSGNAKTKSSIYMLIPISQSVKIIEVCPMNTKKSIKNEI
jgi:hypothetical protein